MLGGDAEVPTLEGRAKLRIPPGSQAGRKFRLGGHGLPAAGNTRGDLYAVVTVELPTTLTVEQRTLWEQLATQP